MRSCDAWREILLEAELDQLSEADSDLGRHLQGCAGCRLAAQRIVHGTSLLDSEISRLAVQEPTRSRPVRTGSINRSSYIAAAAAIMMAIWIGLRLGGNNSSSLAQAEGQSIDPLPVVSEAQGSNIAIFTTRDPNITVVWITQETLQ